MFNFCEYIRTKKFLILRNNESSMATMSHTNVLRKASNNKYMSVYMGWFLGRKCYKNCE